MDNVMEKTRELGQAIMESGEYQRFREAELQAMTDETAATWLSELVLVKTEIAAHLEKPDPDPVKLRSLERRINELDEKLSVLQSVQNWREAKQDFEALVVAVNQELKGIILGDVDGENMTMSGEMDGSGILQ